jgi:hypothetical protein
MSGFWTKRMAQKAPLFTQMFGAANNPYATLSSGGNMAATDWSRVLNNIQSPLFNNNPTDPVSEPSYSGG